MIYTDIHFISCHSIIHSYVLHTGIHIILFIRVPIPLILPIFLDFVVVIAFCIICEFSPVYCNHCEHNVIITTYTYVQCSVYACDFARPECLHLLVNTVAEKCIVMVLVLSKFIIEYPYYLVSLPFVITILI